MYWQLLSVIEYNTLHGQSRSAFFPSSIILQKYGGLYVILQNVAWVFLQGFFKPSFGPPVLFSHGAGH